MQPHTTRIFVFLESMYCSEDFHHAVEHRFFEHESIKNLENEEHTSISAYAHVTGILFKIITARWSKEYVMRVFDEILSDIIPPFSPEEQKRFLQE